MKKKLSNYSIAFTILISFLFLFALIFSPGCESDSPEANIESAMIDLDEGNYSSAISKFQNAINGIEPNIFEFEVEEGELKRADMIKYADPGKVILWVELKVYLAQAHLGRGGFDTLNFAELAIIIKNQQNPPDKSIIQYITEMIFFGGQEISREGDEQESDVLYGQLNGKLNDFFIALHHLEDVLYEEGKEFSKDTDLTESNCGESDSKSPCYPYGFSENIQLKILLNDAEFLSAITLLSRTILFSTIMEWGDILSQVYEEESTTIEELIENKNLSLCCTFKDNTISTFSPFGPNTPYTLMDGVIELSNAFAMITNATGFSQEEMSIGSTVTTMTKDLAGMSNQVTDKACEVLSENEEKTNAELENLAELIEEPFRYMYPDVEITLSLTVPACSEKLKLEEEDVETTTELKKTDLMSNFMCADVDEFIKDFIPVTNVVIEPDELEKGTGDIIKTLNAAEIEGVECKTTATFKECLDSILDTQKDTLTSTIDEEIEELLTKPKDVCGIQELEGD